MLSLNLELLSSLIGLARSVIGNEDLVTNHTNKLIYESLYNLSIDNKDTSFVIKEIEKERQRLVPNCYHCVAKCGKTDNYNTDNLKKIDSKIYEIKSLYLKKILSYSTNIYNAILNGYENIELNNFIYKFLFYIGNDDFSLEDFYTINNEYINAINIICKL